MESKKWAIIGLSAVLGLIGVVGIEIWLIDRTAAKATQLYSVSIPVGDGRTRGRPSNAQALDLSADGQLVVAALEDGTARAWRIGAHDRIEEVAELAPVEIATEVQSLTSLCTTPDGRVAALAFSVHAKAKQEKQQPPPTQTGRVQLWNIEKRTSRTLATLPDPVAEVAVAPRGEAVAVSGNKHHPLRVLDGDTGNVLWSDTKTGFSFGPLAFSPDGKLVAAGVDLEVRVYDARTGRVRRECIGPTGSMLAVSFSADGSRVTAGGVDHNLYIWALNDPKRDVVVPLDLPPAIEPTAEALAFEAESESIVAFIPRAEGPGFFERLQNPPTPGVMITTDKGSLIVRRQITQTGKTAVLLDTRDQFSKIRFARNARIFVHLNAHDCSVGVWRY